MIHAMPKGINMKWTPVTAGIQTWLTDFTSYIIDYYAPPTPHLETIWAFFFVFVKTQPISLYFIRYIFYHIIFPYI